MKRHFLAGAMRDRSRWAVGGKVLVRNNRPVGYTSHPGRMMPNDHWEIGWFAEFGFELSIRRLDWHVPGQLFEIRAELPEATICEAEALDRIVSDVGLD
jgi:hypothetical protein